MTNVKDKVDPEDQYFHREDQEKLRKLREQAEADAAKAALEARKLAHRHKCGKCGADMDTQLFKGVEIEICKDCGAVLLDPGELERLSGKDPSGTFGILSDLFSFNRRKTPDFEPPGGERLS